MPKPKLSRLARSLKKLILWSLLLIKATGSLAEEPHMRRLTVADGLAQSTVHGLLQDRLGFVWIGSGGGLQRYDGYDFVHFEADPFGAEGLTHQEVSCLLEDKSGALWIGTSRGLNLLNGPAAGLTPLTAKPWADAKDWAVSSLTEDAAGQLWVGLRGEGLVRVSADRNELTHLRAGSGALPSDRVQTVIADGRGSVWVGFADARPGRLGAEGFVPLEGLEAQDVRQIVIRGRSAWLATAQGVLRLEPPILENNSESTAAESAGEWRIERLRYESDRPSSLASDDVTALLLDQQDRLWVGGDRGLGLHLGNGRFQNFRHRANDPSSLGHDRIEALLEDASGLIWVGTALGGVTVIDPQPRFTHVRADASRAGSLPSNAVRSLLEDPTGHLWVGSDGGGLARVDSNQDRPIFDRLPSESRVWSLHLDRRESSLWVGHQSGLSRFSMTGESVEQSFIHRPGDEESLAPGAVRALSEDGDGRLWVGLDGGGLSRLSPGENRFEHFRHDPKTSFTLPNDLVLTLFRDRRDGLWIGTAAGLARLTADGRFHSYHADLEDRTSLVGNRVFAIHQDQEGHLWVGTDAGLNRLPAALVQAPPVAAPNNRGFSFFGETDGLIDNTVRAILEDGAGALWLATPRGLSRFDAATQTFSNFGAHETLTGAEFTGAAWRSHSGRLYFGGLNGYVTFEPESIAVRDFAPPVRFTVVTTLHRSGNLSSPIPTEDSVRLGPGDVAASFEFAALDFSQSANHSYAYLLEGRDRDWHDVGRRRTLTLSGLEPGEYVLRVRGTNSDGVWSEQTAALPLVVTASPWRSRWAYLLYTTLILSLAALLLYEINRRRAQRQRLIEALRNSERRMDLAIQGSGDGLWDWDLESGKVFRSGIAEMLGFDPAELPDDHSWRHGWIEEADRQLVDDTLKAHLRGETARFEAEYRVRDHDGRRLWILDRGNVVERDERGNPQRMAGTFKDMTASKKIERELRLWSTVFEAIDEGVVVLDAEGTVKAVNEAFCRLFGKPRHSLIGRPANRLRSAAHQDAFYRRLRRELVVRRAWRGEIRLPRSDGGERLVWVEMRAVEEPLETNSPSRDSAPASQDGGRLREIDRQGPGSSRYIEPSHYVAVISDITRRRRAEEELRYLADYDPLTGLPNRAMFSREAAKAISLAAGEGRTMALLFGDLDQFKQVNDTLGHQVGDLLLQEAARRLLTSVRTDDLVARLGGDEWVVLLRDASGKGIIDRDSAAMVARRILDSFAAPAVLEGQELTVSASLGIALLPTDGDDVETLLKHADTAMYEAKSQGRNRYCFYTRDMSERALARMTLEGRLRRALVDDALVLYYQPILDVSKAKVVGVEAMLRWPQDDGEVWTPEAFLPIAEETGLIVSIGAWVLRQACSRASDWASPKSLHGPLDLSVNVSQTELGQEDFVDQLEEILGETGFNPAHLILEITENAVIDNAPWRGNALDRLRTLGVRLSIDDFGTGFSSLGHLQQLHFDELKIDSSFVHGITDKKSSPIARTILAMAEGMAVSVVAEGVETREQLDVLRRLGCRRVQGDWISPPLPIDELLSLLSSDEPPWAELKSRGRE